MMILTAAQTTTFFTANDQMGIPTTTYAQFAHEEITQVQYLSDFDTATLKQHAENLRCPDGKISVDHENPGGTMMATPSFVFGVKLQKRIAVVLILQDHRMCLDCK